MKTDSIDLKELSKRESERVEWKENVADIEDIIKTAVAFANDISNLGGGYIVCGAKEAKDEQGFQTLIEVGLTSARLKEVEGKMMNDLRSKVSPPIIAVTDEIVVNEERRILVFIIPASRNAHAFRPTGKDSLTYYVRIGRETREARNGMLRELLIQKREVETWDKRMAINSSVADIDLLMLRVYLQEMNVWDPKKDLDDYLSDRETISSFVAPLTEREKVTEILHPRNFSLLMFSREPNRFFPGAYTVFSIYPGKDRSDLTAERHEITGSIVAQARRCIELLNAETYTVFDKLDNIPNQIKYPQRALQEAVVNCLVHRDYEIDQPSRVTVFSDRIEIFSPGTLPRAIDREKFMAGRATPYWRNQSLAYFFNKLQLAQAEGQGIPTIIRSMLEEGCPAPTFEIGPESLTCILPAHPRHSIIKEIQSIERAIILNNHGQAAVDLLEILKRDPYNFRAIDLLCEVSRLMGNPGLLQDFLIDSQIQLNKLNSNSIALIAEVISHIQGDDGYKKFARDLVNYARTISLEERQMEKVVISLKRLGNNEELVEFVDHAIEQNLSLAKNVILLGNRARAKMDLAKICMDTGRDSQKYRNATIRGKAWDAARKYLIDAERDLNQALENVTSYIDREYIIKDLEFLKKMKSMARRPVDTPRVNQPIIVKKRPPKA